MIPPDPIALEVLRARLESVAEQAALAIEHTAVSPAVTESKDYSVTLMDADGRLVVGAGTVVTVEEARQAVAAGARFLVSPVVDPVVIEQATRLGVAMMPGCSTPTEMLQAHRCGAELQKLFPAPGTGPAWVAQTLGPLPFLRIVPTAGVTLDNAAAYLEAGAFAVGFVTSLFEPADVKAGRWDVIESRARAMLAAVRSTS